MKIQEPNKKEAILEDLIYLVSRPSIDSAAVQNWFTKEASYESLSSCDPSKLNKILSLIIKANIDNDKFFRTFLKVISEKLNDFTKEELYDVNYNLISSNQAIEFDFAEKVALQITNHVDTLSPKECIDFMWVMSKSKYRNEDLLNNLANKIISSDHNPNVASTIKLLQSLAELDCNSIETSQYIVNNTINNIDKASNQQLILLAFYSTMLHVNSDAQLMPKQFVEDIISKINLEKVVDLRQKQQLSQIKAAGFAINLQKIVQWEEEVKTYVQSGVIESYTQTKIANEINSIYQKFGKVSLEKWIPQLAASVDIFIEYNATGANLIVEFDSEKYHGYLNDPTREDATTIFHTKIAQLNGINIYRIKQRNLDKNLYLDRIDNILGIVNEKILNSDRKSRNEVVESLKSISSETEVIKAAIEYKPLEDELIQPASIQETKQQAISKKSNKKKKKEEKTNSIEDISDSEASKLLSLIEQNKELEFLEILNQLKQEKNPEEIKNLLNSSITVQKSKKTTISKTLMEIAIDNFVKQEEKAYKERSNQGSAIINFPAVKSALDIIYNLSLNGASIPLDSSKNYKDWEVDLSKEQNIVKLCLYAFTNSKYNDLLLKCLDCIPDTENKKILSQYLFVMVASYHNTELLSYFIDKNININYSCPREIVQEFDRVSKGYILMNNKPLYVGDSDFFLHGLTNELFGSNDNSLEKKLREFSLEVESRLLQQGFHSTNLDNNPEEGLTALHASCFHRDGLKNIKLLLSAGAKVNTVTAIGATPFSSLLFYSSEANGLYFLEHADPNLRVVNMRGQSPLFLAILKDYDDLAVKIIERDPGSIHTVETEHGMTVLFFAVINDKKELALKLIENGAQIDLKTNKGDTAVLEAIKKERKDLVEAMLIAHGSSDILREEGRLVGTVKIFLPNISNFIEKYERNPVDTILTSSVSPIIKAIGFKKLYERDKLKREEAFLEIEKVINEPSLTDKEKEKIGKIKETIETISEQKESKMFYREEIRSKLAAKIAKQTKVRTGK